MKAFGIDNYGPVENFCEKELPKPSDLSPRDLLVRYVRILRSPDLTLTRDRIKAVSVNPVDTKVRNGTYDDYPGLSRTPRQMSNTPLTVRRLLRSRPSTIPDLRLRCSWGSRADGTRVLLVPGRRRGLLLWKPDSTGLECGISARGRTKRRT